MRKLSAEQGDPNPEPIILLSSEPGPSQDMLHCPALPRQHPRKSPHTPHSKLHVLTPFKEPLPPARVEGGVCVYQGVLTKDCLW